MTHHFGGNWTSGGAGGNGGQHVNAFKLKNKKKTGVLRHIMPQALLLLVMLLLLREVIVIIIVIVAGDAMCGEDGGCSMHNQDCILKKH